MKLTRKKTIELCIEAWEILAETGCTKDDLPEKHREPGFSCWLCEYDEQQRVRYDTFNKFCKYCPLVRILGVKCEAHLNETQTFYDKWVNAKTPKARKKYAKLFLAQIKELKCVG